jgi:uncharacterized protein YjiS (DUF1127 family)
MLMFSSEEMTSMTYKALKDAAYVLHVHDGYKMQVQMTSESMTRRIANTVTPRPAYLPCDLITFFTILASSMRNARRMLKKEKRELSDIG